MTDKKTDVVELSGDELETVQGGGLVSDDLSVTEDATGQNGIIDIMDQPD